MFRAIALTLRVGLAFAAAHDAIFRLWAAVYQIIEQATTLRAEIFSV